MRSREFTPDAGWGWMVVFGSFLIHVITDGITYSFGVIVVDLLHDFGNNNFLTSWTSSILVGMTLGSGPVASALANRFGCRSVSMVGSVIAAIGSFISAFATSIPYLIVSVGVIMGSGFGLMFCPSVLIVNMYFERMRAIAIGMAVCGAGIGTFVFAPLSAYLLQVYTWRGVFMIHAGIILNGVVCSSVFRPVEVFACEEEEFVMELAAEQGTEKKTGETNVNEQQTMPKESSPTIISNGGEMDKQTLLKTPTKQKKTPLVKFLREDRYVCQAVSEQCLRPEMQAFARKRCDTFTLGTKDETQRSQYRRRLVQATVSSASECVAPQHVMTMRLRPLQRKDIFLSGTVTNLTYYQTPFVILPNSKSGSATVVGRQRSLPSVERLSSLEAPTPEVSGPGPGPDTQVAIMEPSTLKPYSVLDDIKDSLRQMTDFSILKDPVYLLFAISNFLTNIGYDLPRVFLVEHATRFDIDQGNGSWLLSAWGICNTAGRVLVGWMSDQSWALNHRLLIYNTSLILCGIVNMLTPWCRDFPSLLLYSSLFGLTLSTYISLTSVVLVDLLGLEKLTSAYGLLLFFQGLAAVIGPPIGGLIVDHMGTYLVSFIFAGIVIFISGAMLIPIPCIRRSQGYAETASVAPVH